MAVPVSTLITHLEYSAWASRQLVDAARSLSADELLRDFGTADRHILGTLVHVFAADRVWLGRVEGTAPQPFIDAAKDMKFEVLDHDWPALHDRWIAWAMSLTDAMAAGSISYRDLKGNPHSTPVWQIVLHVVNHATHHRGQAAGFIRSTGHTPPVLDLIRFYRDRAAGVSA